MSAPTEIRCICGHAEKTHVFDGLESVCAKAGCTCKAYHVWQVIFLAPDLTHHTVTDVAKFVRDHADLFDAEDLRPRKYRAGNAATHSSWIPAETYLTQLGRPSKRHTVCSWKNWEVLCCPKTYLG
jgi:hypothetical protein